MFNRRSSKERESALSQRIKRVSGQPTDDAPSTDGTAAPRSQKNPGQAQARSKAVFSRAPRETVFKDAVIEFAGGQESVVVRNLSLTGARVDTSHSMMLPDRLRISIPSIGLRRTARVVWHDHQSAGIEFE